MNPADETFEIQGENETNLEKDIQSLNASLCDHPACISGIPIKAQTSIHNTDVEAGPELANVKQSSATGNYCVNTECPRSNIRVHDVMLLSMPNFRQKLTFFVRTACSWKGQGQQTTSSKLNALSTLTMLLCVCFLFLYIAPLRSRPIEAEPSYHRESDHKNQFRSLNIGSWPLSLLTSSSEETSAYTWNTIQKLFQDNSDKKRLHIQVSGTTENRHNVQSNIAFKTHDDSLKIYGKPNYCIMNDQGTPENVVISGTTYLHLSKMDDCHHYTNIILTRWKFPKIQHVKLHRMLIREQEFHALTQFIDRHNETLQRVEIDECILCPSPYCDAGLINFPEHDFQITITRQRESPNWI